MKGKNMATPNLLVIARAQRDQDFRDRLDAAARYNNLWADSDLVWHVVTQDIVWQNMTVASNGGVDATKVTDQQILDIVSEYATGLSPETP